MIRIIIGDDNCITREGFKQIINTQDDMRVEREAVDGNELLAHLRLQEVDIHLVVIDINISGLNGIDLIKRINLAKPGLPILIFSTQPEDDLAIRLLKSGASGYITKKDLSPQVLIDAIRRLANGGKHISRSLTDELINKLNPAIDKPKHESLSDREYAIFRLIVAGKSLTEIATELSVSPNTISTHKGRIMYKLRVNNNADLIHYANSNHLFQ